MTHQLSCLDVRADAVRAEVRRVAPPDFEQLMPGATRQRVQSLRQLEEA